MGDMSPFPNERVPRATDTRQAAAPLDPKLFENLKQKLGSTGGTSHFSAESLFDSPQPRRSSGLHYPISLFVDFPDQPPAETLDHLVLRFQTVVLPSLPFLRHVSSCHKDTNGSPRKPTFLKMACASLGAVARADQVTSSWASKIWHAALLVHSTSVEVDNSVARTVDWVLGWILLQVYGVSQTNAEVWSKTNAWNGHVDTTVHRMMATQAHQFWISDRGLAPTANSNFRNCMSFYFLIDQLRALTFSTTASFTPIQLPIRLSSNQSFINTHKSLLAEEPLQVIGLSMEDKLLLLIGILSEIISFQRDLGMLLDPDVYESMSLEHSPRSRPGLQQTSVHSFNPSISLANPYLKNSAAACYSDMEQILARALRKWEALPIVGDTGTDPETRCIYLGMKELAKFCGMLLSGGPEVLNLCTRVGFSLAAGFNPPSSTGDIKLPRVTDKTLKLAWETLDASEAVNDHAESVTSEMMSPVWSPIVCFMTGLVISAQQHTDGEQSPGLQQSRNLMRLFELQLKQMTWPNARDMLRIMKSLRGR